MLDPYNGDARQGWFGTKNPIDQALPARAQNPGGPNGLPRRTSGV